MSGLERPTDWDDAGYLAANPDVADAVKANAFRDGWQHYTAHGWQENRSAHWLDVPGMTLTRNCLDPWNYLEITPSHGLKPCCKYDPIAQWEPGGNSIEKLRNSVPFRELRARLLSGDLTERCRDCHIRPMVPARNLQVPIALMAGSDRANQVSASLPLRHLRLELTTKCNLRCVYCAVSQPEYDGRHMSVETFDQILALLDSVEKDVEILVNGHGETTYHPQWLELCSEMIRRGFRPTIITNLARPFTASEHECLAQFGVIQVSIDTVDPELLSKLRRRVKLATIVDNIQEIRRAADRLGSKPPIFTLSCGVFDVSIEGLEGVAHFAIEHRVGAVTFWNLVKYADIQGDMNVHSMDSLGQERVWAAVEHLERAIVLLQAAGIATELAGGFLAEWRVRLQRAAG